MGGGHCNGLCFLSQKPRFFLVVNTSSFLILLLNLMLPCSAHVFSLKALFLKSLPWTLLLENPPQDACASRGFWNWVTPH